VVRLDRDDAAVVLGRGYPLDTAAPAHRSSKCLRHAPAWPQNSSAAERGHRKLYLDTVTQAAQGVDFDFLRSAQRTAAWHSATLSVHADDARPHSKPHP
jgi:hypothetical protein